MSMIQHISFSAVNFDDLVCEDDEGMAKHYLHEFIHVNLIANFSPTEDSGIQLCATNGVTYNSLCQLLQDTGNVRVAFVGACDSVECSGGSVSNQEN